MKKDMRYLYEKKAAGVPITMVTAYDFPSARLLDEADVDCVLVGDSLGTNVLGYSSEREVTLSDMIHHVAAVRRGVEKAFIIADLPYGYADDINKAVQGAKALTDSGAECVKIEGWGEKADIILKLCDMGISVCAHMGYNPQIHDRPQVFGRDEDQAAALLDGAGKLQEAGAGLVILEMVPKKLSGVISKTLTIPAIGIGSGNLCDGQVLVINDLLGLSPKIFKHARAFADLRGAMSAAFRDYAGAVRKREFPGDENSW